MAELWRKTPAWRPRPVPAGFEASTEGGVRWRGEVLPQVADKDGYLRVRVAGRWFPVAWLVILAWQGPPEVRHLGESNQGNKPAELAYGGRRENERDKKNKEKGEGKGGVTVPSASVTPVTGGQQR